MILATRLRLHPARHVNRERMCHRDRFGDVLGPQPTGDDRRDLGAMLAQQPPVEAFAGTTPEAFAAPVKEMSTLSVRT